MPRPPAVDAEIEARVLSAASKEVVLDAGPYGHVTVPAGRWTQRWRPDDVVSLVALHHGFSPRPPFGAGDRAVATVVSFTFDTVYLDVEAYGRAQIRPLVGHGLAKGQQVDVTVGAVEGTDVEWKIVGI